MRGAYGGGFLHPARPVPATTAIMEPHHADDDLALMDRSWRRSSGSSVDRW
jgi:hypothetical protein